MRIYIGCAGEIVHYNFSNIGQFSIRDTKDEGVLNQLEMMPYGFEQGFVEANKVRQFLVM